MTTKDTIYAATRYDRATGDVPRVGDRVENCHCGNLHENGEYKGIFAGWSDHTLKSGIIILDTPLKTGELVIAFPVVCLRIIK